MRDDLNSYLLAVVALCIVAAALLLWRVRAERRRTGIALLFALGSAAASFGLDRLTDQAPALLRYLHYFSILGVGLAAIYLVGLFGFRLLLPTLGLRLPRIHQDICISISSLAWAFIWLRENGVELGSLIATSAVVTAVVAFSLQDTLGNILGGMAIQIDQSVRVGDWIQIDRFVGKVTEITWRHVSLETRNWETVVVPNSQLVKNSFLVLGRRHGQPVQWRRWVWFNVDFRFPPSQVIEVVEAAILKAKIHHVADFPPPNCIVTEFSESYAKYAVRYWLTDLAVDDPTDSEVRTHIFAALRRAGITLSIPAHAVFLTEESTERKERHAERELQRRLNALQKVELFHHLTPGQLRDLASSLEAAPFVEGDLITRRGDPAESIYLMISGQADILVEGPDREVKKLAEVGPGGYFGEIAVLTGEPRSASVVARSPVEAYRLEKQAFKRALRLHPRLEEQILELIETRRREVSEVIKDLDQAAEARRLAQMRTDIRTRLKQFFSGADSP